MSARAGAAMVAVGLSLLALAGCGGNEGARDTARFGEEVFRGSNSTGPFDVRFAPILADGSRAVINGQSTTLRQALVVLVDNVEQQEGVDFDALRQTGRIVFRRVIPRTATVRVRYYYLVRPGGDWAPTPGA